MSTTGTNQQIKIVGLVYQRLNNVSTLPPYHDFGGDIGEVIFHNDPRVEMVNGIRVSNVDAFIDLRFNANMEMPTYFHDKYYGYRRPSKQKQWLELLKFNNKDDFAPILKAPQQYITWSNNHLDGSHPISRFGVIDCAEVVMKSQYGSSGCNHVVAPSHMVQTILKHVTRLSGDEFGVTFPDVIVSRGSNTDTPIFESFDEIVITERITNVDKEWRILFGGNGVYVREREITLGDYSQSNLCATVIPNIAEVEYIDMGDCNVPQEVIETIYALIEHINLPFGSIDLYHTTDGDYGIFEYCEQFGFHGARHEFIRQLHLDGIEQILKKMFNV